MLKVVWVMSKFVSRSCPFCGSFSLKVVSVSSKLARVPAGLTRGNDANFQGIKCADCKSLTADELYDSKQYVSGVYSNSENYKHIKPGYDYTGDFVERVSKFSRGGRVLDFGAGQGTTAEFIQSKGVAIDVLEPDSGFQKTLRGTFKNVYCSLDEVKIKYRVIYAIGVLEHLDDIRATPCYLSEKLEDDGILLFQYPNINSLSARLMLGSWDMIFEPGHNFIPSVDGLMKLLNGTDLEIFNSYSSSILTRGRIPWCPKRFDKLEQWMKKLLHSSLIARFFYVKLWQFQSSIGLGETVVVSIRNRKKQLI